MPIRSFTDSPFRRLTNAIHSAVCLCSLALGHCVVYAVEGIKQIGRRLALDFDVRAVVNSVIFVFLAHGLKLTTFHYYKVWSLWCVLLAR